MGTPPAPVRQPVLVYHLAILNKMLNAHGSDVLHFPEGEMQNGQAEDW